MISDSATPAPAYPAGLHRLSVGDLFNFWAEGPNSPMQIGLAGTFHAPRWLDDRGQLRLSWLADQVERRTHRVPLLRRRIRWTSFGEGRPIWLDDPDFDIAFHVTSVPSVDGDLTHFWSRAAEQTIQPLDRHRPLWRMIFTPGLEGGRIGMVFVIHHVAVDGLAGVAALSDLLDVVPDQLAPHKEWRPQPPPSRGRLVADNMATRLRAVPPLVRAIPRLPVLINAIRGTTHAVQEDAPATSLAGTIAASREAAVISTPLDQIHRVAEDAGMSVNDYVLAALTTGLREWLAARSELRPGLALRASMPVAVPGRQQNAGRMVVVPLPVAESDAARRLSAIHNTTSALKVTQADVAHTEITGSPLFPISLMRISIPWLARRGGLKVNCFLTNVRGPRKPLYLAGAQLDDAVPFAPLVAGVRLGVTVFSYAGTLTITLLGDGQLPDWSTLVTATRDSLVMSGRAFRTR
ncbi:MAG TPA: wax ester/triacylglycerol synthase domain-containing protein [Propionibacteriaceae bacterium]|nr:wax ester/triacylglycerol synthase domain-containing protein [Propionibacteriaceae bacterium]